MLEVIVESMSGRHSDRADVQNLQGVETAARALARDLVDHLAVPYHSIRATLLVDGTHLVTAPPHQLRERAQEALRNDERRAAR